MKYWLALVCVLGTLCGGVLTAYSAITVGSDGLNSMGVSLQNISKVISAYSTNLNAARNTVMPAITNLATYVNTTYMALNRTYGATQTNMAGMMSNLPWFTQQFMYADQMVSSYIASDLSQLNSQLQQTIDQILQNYNTLINSFAYQQNGDSCTAQFSAVAGSIPIQLTKFGQCLQMEVDTVPIVVAPVLAIFTLVQNDLVSLNQQLQICATTSTNCISAYFQEIYSELSYVNMELYLAQSLLSSYQQDAMQRNQLCGQLINSNVQDISQNLQTAFSQCMYPQAAMG